MYIGAQTIIFIAAFFDSSLKLETTKEFINSRIHKYIEINIGIGIFYKSEKECTMGRHNIWMNLKM